MRFNWFKKKPKWTNQATLVFRDSKGKAYFKFDDELGHLIPRLDMADVVRREIDSRIDSDDLKVFLSNHKSIIHSDQKPVEKLKQLADHVRILEERKDLPPAPELLMKLVMLFYIREDEDPWTVDEKIWKEKTAQILADMDGGLAPFFLESGLGEFLPFSTTSIDSIEELLRRTQAFSQTARKREAELKEAIS